MLVTIMKINEYTYYIENEYTIPAMNGATKDGMEK